VAVGSAVAGVGSQARADLVLCDIDAKEIGREGNVSVQTKFVIEVKRGNASTQTINADLTRLHAFLQVATNGTRCFLFIVSESRAPTRFVKDGKSILGAQNIPGTTGNFRVRRSVKAAASFSGKESAHYVCLLEVFLEGQKSEAI
jgi:hypothetical protein